MVSARTLQRAFLAMIGASLFLLEPTLPQQFAVADLPILLTLIAGGSLALNKKWARVWLRPLRVPLFLIAVGTFLGAFHSGFPTYFLVRVVKDAGSLAFLALGSLVALHAARKQRAVPEAALAIGVGLGSLGVVLLGGGGRAKGTFPHPNLAGHFLATGVLYFVATRHRLRWPICGVAAVALIETGSFGALIQLTGGIAYLVMTARGANGQRPRRALRIGVLTFLGAFVLIAGLALNVDLASNGFNAERFDRSSQGRQVNTLIAVDLALEYPLGVGAGTVENEELLALPVEVHNDLLAYWVERSLLGAIGLALLVRVVWRKGVSGGPVRVLLVSFVLASLFRATLNYRHIWFCLALAFAFEAAVDGRPRTTTGVTGDQRTMAYSSR
jgi:hypothetical protein